MQPVPLAIGWYQHDLQHSPAECPSPTDARRRAPVGSHYRSALAQTSRTTGSLLLDFRQPGADPPPMFWHIIFLLLCLFAVLMPWAPVIASVPARQRTTQASRTSTSVDRAVPPVVNPRLLGLPLQSPCLGLAAVALRCGLPRKSPGLRQRAAKEEPHLRIDATQVIIRPAAQSLQSLWREAKQKGLASGQRTPRHPESGSVP